MTSALPRIVARRRVHDGWNKLDIITVEDTGSDGIVRRSEREVVDHGDAAVVLVIDRRRDVALLVRQWRAGLIGVSDDPYLLEACAGIVDAGETVEEAARREVEEEIGLTVGELQRIGTIVPSAGTLTERMHLFVADAPAGQRSKGGGNAHEGEEIEIVEMPLRELFALARSGGIEDAKTLVIAQKLMIEELEGAAA